MSLDGTMQGNRCEEAGRMLSRVPRYGNLSLLFNVMEKGNLLITISAENVVCNQPISAGTCRAITSLRKYIVN